MPVPLEYWPETQLEQLDCPLVPLNWPAAHAVHTVAAAATEIWPAAQVPQVEANDWPVRVEYLPATQFTHAVAEPTVWYVPAAQFVHTVAPVVEYWPVTQFEQDVADAPEYDPPRQAMQLVDPEVPW